MAGVDGLVRRHPIRAKAPALPGSQQKDKRGESRYNASVRAALAAPGSRHNLFAFMTNLLS